MVTITKENHGIGTSSLSLPDGPTFIRLIECLKPFTYLGIGMALGLVILNSGSEEKLLRGSSFNSVQMKNMSTYEPPRIHIDINFPDHQSEQILGGGLPTINLVEDGAGNTFSMKTGQDPQQLNVDTAYNSMARASGQETMYGTTGLDRGAVAPAAQMEGQMQENNQMRFDQDSQMQAGAGSLQNGGQMQAQPAMQDRAQMQSSQSYATPMATTGMSQKQTGTPPMLQDATLAQQTSNLSMQSPDSSQPQQFLQNGGQMQTAIQNPASFTATTEMGQMQAGTLPMQDATAASFTATTEMGQMQVGTLPMQDATPASFSATTEMDKMQVGTLPMQDDTLAQQSSTLSMQNPDPLQQQQFVQNEGQMQTLPMDGSDQSQMQKQAQELAPEEVPAASSVVSAGESRPVMYTFYDRIEAGGAGKGKRSTGMDDKSDNELLALWKTHWENAGWEPRILSLEDAKKHASYDHYVDRLASLPMDGVSGKGNNRMYNQLCFLRWLAMASVGGGFMSDYDLFPLGYGTGDLATPPSVALPNNGDFTVYSVVPDSQNAAVPCLMSARGDEWTRLAMKILGAAVNMKKDEKSHITDMFALIALRFENTYIAVDEVMNGEYVLLGRDWAPEDCEITNGKRAIHFSHHAIEVGDASYIKEGELAPSDRPGVISHWMSQWMDVCPSK